MTVSSGAATVFGWLVNLTTIGGFIGWWVMNYTYLCFCESPLFTQEVAQIQTIVRLRIQEAGIRQKEALLLQFLSAISRVVGCFLDNILPHHLRSPDMVRVEHFHLPYLL